MEEPPSAALEGGSGTVPSSISAAFVLGWRLAELYDRKELPPPPEYKSDAPVPAHLPGASEMSENEVAVVILEQASSALATLSSVLKVDVPSLGALRTVLDRPGHQRDDVRREILSAYLAVRDGLAGVSPLVGISCGLGRMLADTALLSRTSKPDILTECFDTYRLANAYRWLDDLSTAFPLQSSSAVKSSLAAWENWVAELPRKNEALDPSAVDVGVIRCLRSQGEMWSRLLAGEVLPESLLGLPITSRLANGSLNEGGRLRADS